MCIDIRGCQIILKKIHNVTFVLLKICSLHLSPSPRPQHTSESSKAVVGMLGREKHLIGWRPAFESIQASIHVQGPPKQKGETDHTPVNENSNKELEEPHQLGPEGALCAINLL